MGLFGKKPLEVGLKRSKQLKNKVVVRGLVQSGVFNINDSAVIVQNGSETATSILDVIPCGGVSDFATALAANTHKKTAEKDINAWLILDAEGGVAKGDLIAIR